MRKGKLIEDDLKNVDCDPRLKILIAEIAYNCYELYKQQAQIVETMNGMLDSYQRMVNGIGNRMNEITKKVGIIDADGDETKVCEHA